MIYDENPPYPHYDHLPYAKEPLKSFYVFQRLFTTLALVPIWVLYYSVIPRRYRPRSSWNLRQVVNVKFTRRIFRVTEVAGVTWGTRDPNLAPDEKSLKETRFQWVDPLPERYQTGIIANSGVPFKKVGCYIWPQQAHHAIQKGKINPAEDAQRLTSSVDLELGNDKVPLVGIFMHGGGYCHMSAHESSPTSRIPRNLVKRKIMQEVYSVEYRLLQHAPFPAVVQDAAAVYAHVVEQYGIKESKCKVILIGDSSGGNLVLSLARWLRDEGRLPLPHGLLLLSPSCDASHALPVTLSPSIPRPNKSTDYLVDTPAPRALLQRTFLGFKRGPFDKEEERRLVELVHSEYISPCSPIVLKRWGHETKEDPEGQHEARFVKHIFKRLPTDLRAMRAPENLEPGPVPIVPATATASLAAAATASEISLLAKAPPTVKVDMSVDVPPGQRRDVDNPYHKSARFPTLFGGFPRTMVACGDAERLVREVRSMAAAMEKDGVDLTMHWARDACHDPLMLNEHWWDRAVLEGIWEGIAGWANGFGFDRERSDLGKSGGSFDEMPAQIGFGEV